MESYWEDSVHQVKYESDATVPPYRYCSEAALNFSTSGFMEDDVEYGPQGRRSKVSRQDPQSHRIIEKRRRDRMNSCLADLSRLIPQQYLRKGRGRVEKTEIIEMAIRHLKHLHLKESNPREISWSDQYRMGYQECLTETARYFIGGGAGTGTVAEPMCLQLVAHLRDHCEELLKGDFSTKSRSANITSASSGSPTNYCNSNTEVVMCGLPTREITESPPTMPMIPVSTPSHLREILTSCSDLSNDAVKDLTLHPKNATQSIAYSLEANEKTEHNYTGSEQSDIIAGDFEVICRNRLSSFRKISANTCESVLRSVRKNIDNDSHLHNDIENNNNSYKFKNYIKQRFSQSQDVYSDTDKGIYNGSENESIILNKRPKAAADDDNSSDRTENLYDTVIGNKLAGDIDGRKVYALHCHKMAKSNLNIPIFALHANGTFYLPLTIEYEALRPYLPVPDLLEATPVPHIVPHPVTISVAFTQGYEKPIASAAGGHSHSLNLLPKLENPNGW